MEDLQSVLSYAKNNNYPISNKKGLYVEYLQHEILKSVFKHTDKLHFIGGTCLRIVHKIPRFSEDLDFDNFGLEEKDFEVLIDYIQKDMTLLGFSVEFRNVYKGAYHCYFKFSDILYTNDLSPNKDEKILVRLDTVKQDVDIIPQVTLLDNFGLFFEVKSNPIDVLLSQKFLAVLGRKRSKGRDFFDITYLMAKTTPNMAYIEKKIGIKTEVELRQKMLSFCETVNFDEMYEEVKPFLFSSDDGIRIKKFKQYMEQWDTH
ncbi:nucleotidyl transferase AbiEii/AbiGii toxin family protein [Patescibacteria group bacterium]|nr:nucleotidyl transferase AbiEii/AbiGii toxin family protein [Patescibacteria group bacterium]MBU1722088.1 nucleotidyl transferase AbiEii/AbiGii toxin family protein [Patescibacteria group bacterium]MBU1901368.1 nucleotidyl transferase AbiEii/AbiGii toxin family protein [Patescibacteria group bacterium]